MSSKENSQEIILNDRFKLIKHIGRGKFSEVYQGYDLHLNEEVAIKYQKKHAFHTSKTNLYKENLILQNLQNINGVPEKKLFLEDQSHDLLVLPIYKETLRSLYDRLGHFTLKTVVILAMELLDILENIHEKNIVHLDLKPENIMIGTNDKNARSLCIIDYGLSERFIDETNQSHVLQKNTYVFTGTNSYASINSHLGITLSRRDDLESLGYILIEFINGNLPWQQFTQEKNEEKFKKTQKIKKEMSTTKLCQGAPAKFKDYFSYVRNLQFDQKPDYKYLKQIFLEIMKDYKFQDVERSQIYEWIQKENEIFVNSAEESNEVHKIYQNYLKNNEKSPSKSPTACKNQYETDSPIAKQK